MPAIIPFIPLIASGIGAASSALSASSGKKTVSAPSYTPQQSAVQNSLGSSIQNDLANPANLDPEKAAATGTINTGIDNLQTRLQNNESSRGFGASGRAGLKSSQLEVQRSDQLGGLEDQFAKLQLDQNNEVRRQAQAFGFQTPTTTSTTTGSGLAAGLGSGSESLTTLFYLNKLLKGGGSSGDPAATNGAPPSGGGEWQSGDDAFSDGGFGAGGNAGFGAG